MEEAPAAPAADPAPPAPPGAVKSMAETLPAALEPELRRIIDTAVARVAAIELEAIREARELTQRSEQEAREALRFALDRAFNLINTLELLAATVSGMADALKIELDDAIDALRNVPEPESELAKELAQSAPPQEAPRRRRPRPSRRRRRSRRARRQSRRQSRSRAAAEPPPPVAEPRPRSRSAEARPKSPQPRSPLAEEPAPEEVPAAVSRGNGYAPAERQAESLAVASAASRSRSRSPSRRRSARSSARPHPKTAGWCLPAAAG